MLVPAHCLLEGGCGWAHLSVQARGAAVHKGGWDEGLPLHFGFIPATLLKCLLNIKSL